jgi:hypothetical protein
MISTPLVRTLGALALICLVATASVLLPQYAATAKAKIDPVLGKAHHLADDEGFGTPRPHRIFNGGVPSGSADSIHWRRWGKEVARGHGLTPIYAPQGGYYAREGRIQFRATNQGRCYPGGPLAYRTLRAREVDRPGGSYGAWFTWQPDICGND